MVNAQVTSKIDYFSSLLYGTVDKNFVRQKRLQNTAARLIMRVPKYANITPVLQELHWLPVRDSVCFKIMYSSTERSTVVDQCRGDLHLHFNQITSLSGNLTA